MCTLSTQAQTVATGSETETGTTLIAPKSPAQVRQLPPKLNLSAYIKACEAATSPQKLATLIVEAEQNALRSLLETRGGKVKWAKGRIACVIVPYSLLPTLAEAPFVRRIEDAPRGLTLFNDSTSLHTRADSVKAGLSGFPAAYKGKGVVFGLLDTGIDWTHPDFKNADGTTRILALWDHRVNDLTGVRTPQPYGYGTVWSSSDIDDSLCTHIDNQSGGHGTHVAGTGAGNGLAVGAHEGVAPEATIIAVGLNFNQSTDNWLVSIVEGAEFIYNTAAAAGMPTVINLSAGTYYTGHDGLDLAAQLINNMVNAAPGRAFVCAAGNAGDSFFHVGKDLVGDSAFTYQRRNTGNYIYGEIYGDSAELSNFSFRITADRITATQRQARAATPEISFNSAAGVLRRDTLRRNNKIIAKVETYAEYYFGQAVLYYIVYADSAYHYRIRPKGTGRYDIYSSDNAFVTTGLPTSAEFAPMAFHQAPDLLQNIIGSYGCSPDVISVGAYNNIKDYIDIDGNTVSYTHTVGQIAGFSSSGPTRFGGLKPEVSAPGAPVISCKTAQEVMTTRSRYVAGGMHKRNSGTSMASPAVAGIIALMMEAAPGINNTTIRRALLEGAYQDIFTGNATHSLRFGYGKASATGVLRELSGGITSLPASWQNRSCIAPNVSVNATTVTGAQAYEFEFRDTANSLITSVIQATKTLNLGTLGFIQPTTTYRVRVRAQLAGEWGLFGNVTQFSTGLSIPTATQLRAADCNKTKTPQGQISAQTVCGATGYTFEFKQGLTTVATRTQKGNTLLFSNVAALQAGQTYDVQVRAKGAGGSGPFGSVCQIIIQAPTLVATTLRTFDCGRTNVALNGYVLVNKVADATGYLFTLTDTSTGTTITANSSNGGLQLAPLSLNPATVYSVVVQATAGLTIGPVGPVCYITTTSNPRLAGESALTAGTSLPYPNPFSNELWLPTELSVGAEELIISDLTGRVVKQGVISNPISLDANLPEGLYSLEVRYADGSRKSTLVQKANL